MKGLIKRLLREGLIKENQYDKYIVLGKDVIDRIRKINPPINKELSSSVFNSSNVYAKGGAARLALLIYCELDNNGGLHGNDIIRDSDFVYLGEYDDYQKDYPIYRDYDVDYEGETFEKYFNRRDITLNEVLLRPDKLMFTRRAYRDAMKNVVNPSKGNDKKYGLNDRLAARMFLFASRYGYKPVDSFKFNCDDYDAFDFLVCLLKAYELGIEVKFFNLFKEYCNEFDSLSDWLAFLMVNTGGFNYYGRENGLINDLSSVSDSELKSELEEKVYPEYPELKKAVDKLNIDDESDYFKHYLTKHNRGVPSRSMRRTTPNMALAEGELKRDNFKNNYDYQEALINQKNSKLKKIAIKNINDLVKVEGPGTYELYRGSEDGNENFGSGIYAYGTHYTNDIDTALEFGTPFEFDVKLNNPMIVNVSDVKKDNMHAEERANYLKSKGYDSLVVKHNKILTVNGFDFMVYELPYVEYEVIKF